MALDEMVDEFGPYHSAGGFELLRPGGFLVADQDRVGVRTKFDDLKTVACEMIYSDMWMHALRLRLGKKSVNDMNKLLGFPSCP